MLRLLRQEIGEGQVSALLRFRDDEYGRPVKIVAADELGIAYFQGDGGITFIRWIDIKSIELVKD
ncbi:hypothetical protein [Erythrobacter sp. MTPC3]|uniref:hypothetical protein n=1 Tax=Erythrobacter sp. MTPC3 TaxID=3056564 RepID=UPI0036F1D525